jgi:[ribosomal protein S18]-alanine N-acetyltransferase
VGDRRQDGPGLTVRLGGRDDAPFVVGLGATAFARFGVYGPIMREFLASRDVTSYIAETDGEKVGFALLESPETHPGFADLVAIAVDSRHRRTGVGRALLSRVIATLEARSAASLLVLTVAEDNDPAIALFGELGFELIPGAFGRYAGGQTSRRMARYVLPRRPGG